MKKTILAVYLIFFLTLAFIPSAEAKMIIKFPHALSIDSPPHLGAVKFAELVSEKSKQDMEVQIFPSAQMGGIKEVLGGLKTGTTDMTRMDILHMDLLAKGTGGNVFIAPYVFRDLDHFQKTMKSPVWQEITDSFHRAKPGVRLLGYFGDRAPRQLTTKKTIVREPADVKGLKLRIWVNPIHQQFWTTLGAITGSCEMKEMFQGLQQGVFEAQDNGIDMIMDFSVYEVQKYFIRLDYCRSGWLLVMSDRVWNKCTPQQQKILTEACIESGEYQARKYYEREKKDFDFIKTKGMIFVEPNVPAFMAVADKLLKEWDSSGRDWPKGLAGRIQSIK